jgi:hypothetical protein
MRANLDDRVDGGGDEIWREIHKPRVHQTHLNHVPAHKSMDHRVQIEWQWPLSGVHSIISAGLRGYGVHAHPLLLYLPSHAKVQCTIQLRGQMHFPYFISTPMYSVVWTSYLRTELTSVVDTHLMRSRNFLLL